MRFSAKWVPALLVLLGCVAYADSFTGPFVFDDVGAIVQNARVRSLWPLWWAMASPPQLTTSGRPVLSLSLAIDYAAAGGLKHVWVYHATNLLVHLAAGLALYGVARRTLLRMRAEGGKWANVPAEALAGFAAAIFLVHPLQTESVTYVVQRCEAMVGLFCFLTLYCFIRATEDPSTPASLGDAEILPRSQRRPWTALALVCCALGMGTKEVMAAAPPVVLLYDRAFVAGSFREALRRRGGFYLLLAATWVIPVAIILTGQRSESLQSGADVTLAYLRTQCAVVAHYLKLLVWPHPLVLDYFWPFARTWAEVWPQAALLAALLGLTAVSVVRWPKLGFVLASAVMILAPSSSIVPIVTEVAAEHRMYIPVAAAAILAVVGAWRLAEFSRLRRFAMLLLGCAIVCTLATLTFLRNRDYRTGVALWTRTLEDVPRNPRAHYNLAEAYAGAGDLPGAEREMREAIRLMPDYYIARRRLGAILDLEGNLSEADRVYSEEIDADPMDGRASAARGWVRMRLGRLNEAKADLLAAIRINANDADARYRLGLLLEREGKLEEALDQYAAVATIRPDWPEPRQRLDAIQRKVAGGAP